MNTSPSVTQRGRFPHLESERSVVNHEIRTPLTVIIGRLELLVETPGAIDVRYREHIEAIVRNTDRLLTAVEGLLIPARDAGDRDVRLTASPLPQRW